MINKVHPDERVLTCPQCGHRGEPKLEAKSNGAIRANCNSCGAYIKFVKQVGNERDLLGVVLKILPRLTGSELGTIQAAIRGRLE